MKVVCTAYTKIKLIGKRKLSGAKDMPLYMYVTKVKFNVRIQIMLGLLIFISVHTVHLYLLELQLYTKKVYFK